MLYTFILKIPHQRIAVQKLHKGYTIIQLLAWHTQFIIFLSFISSKATSLIYNVGTYTKKII